MHDSQLSFDLSCTIMYSEAASTVLLYMGKSDRAEPAR